MKLLIIGLIVLFALLLAFLLWCYRQAMKASD